MRKHPKWASGFDGETKKRKKGSMEIGEETEESAGADVKENGRPDGKKRVKLEKAIAAQLEPLQRSSNEMTAVMKRKVAAMEYQVQLQSLRLFSSEFGAVDPLQYAEFINLMREKALSQLRQGIRVVNLD